MGEYLPWLAKQEGKTIWKENFPALVLGKAPTSMPVTGPIYFFKSQGCSPSLPTSTARNLIIVALYINSVQLISPHIPQCPAYRSSINITIITSI